MPEIIARKKEIALFNQVLSGSEACLMAIYGRRRIGKTYLIEQFFRDKGIFFHCLGIEKATLEVQLTNFAQEFAATFEHGIVNAIPTNWIEAFTQLSQAIQKLQQQTSEKIILFFDELPWFASQKSGFLSALEHCWNRYLVNLPNVIMILCGSAASWMIKNIVNNKGGLHGRIHHKINLKPFHLDETEQFLKSRGIQLDHKQIVDLYMCIGGVAQYLKYIKRGLSSEQNINHLCFQSSGALYHEFAQLYRSLFKNYKLHISVVRALAATRRGLSYADIAQCTGLTSGGGLSTILKELTAADFVRTHVGYEQSYKVTKYYLADEFTLFYLIWMEPQQKTGFLDDDQEYWHKQHNTSAWHIWSGYAFEDICTKHLSNIKKALGIAAVQTQCYPWLYRPDHQENEGTQIDLVMDRKDQCINLCEIKYYNDEFVINKEYAKKLRRQKQIFIEQTKTKKAIFMTLITTYGIKKNEYSLELIDKELTVDDLFES